MHEALDLPEIRTLIGHFALRSSLPALCLVSRSFNESFAPFLYETMVIHTSTSPSLDALQRNALHIRDLSCTLPFNSVSLNVAYPHLQRLELRGWSGPRIKFDLSAKISNQESLVRLIRSSCAHLRLIIISGLWPSHKNLLWDAIAQCPQLEKLEVMNIKIEREELGDPNAFWRACANAGWLRLDSVWFTFDLDIPTVTVAVTSAPHRGEKKEHNETHGFFPKVCHLGLRIGDDLDAVKQLQLMQQCSNMRSLDWAPPPRTFTSRTCMEMIQSSGSDLLWPKLDTLYVSGKDIHDHDVATMLKSINCVIKLAAGYSRFSSGALRALRPHFTTLKVLDLQNCLETDATMTQEILTNCQHLTLFYGRVIWMNDLIGDAPTGETGTEHSENRLKPWVCPNLKSFEIGSVLVEGGLSLNVEELLRRKEVLLKRLQWLPCLQEYDRMRLLSHFAPERHDVRKS